MDYSSLTARLRELRSEIQRTMEAGPNNPEVNTYPEWYAGLAVTPASFSQQLGEMQVAMQRANGIPIESVPARKSGAIR